MRKFTPQEINVFLLALDKRLTGPVYFETIGSTAAMLAFGLNRDTKDFDTISSVDAVSQAWDETALQTGLGIPLDKVSVHQPPYEYASRLKVLVIPGLKKIKIAVPEKHDWAIMKMARGYDKDLDHIQDVASRLKFSSDVFLGRFLDEMHMSHGNKSELIYSFVSTMEALFGSKIAKEMDGVIRADKRWK